MEPLSHLPGARDGDPHGSKGVKAVDNLETTEEPENSPIGIMAFPPEKVAGAVAQLKSIFSNACNMGKEQEELEIS